MCFLVQCLSCLYIILTIFLLGKQVESIGIRDNIRKKW